MSRCVLRVTQFDTWWALSDEISDALKYEATWVKNKWLLSHCGITSVMNWLHSYISCLCVHVWDSQEWGETQEEKHSVTGVWDCLKSCACLCVCKCARWLINCCCTLAWEPSLQEKVSRWSLVISVLWNALWTCWPPPPCHRHTLPNLEYCDSTHKHTQLNKQSSWLSISKKHLAITRRQKNGFTIPFQKG